MQVKWPRKLIVNWEQPTTQSKKRSPGFDSTHRGLLRNFIAFSRRFLAHSLQKFASLADVGSRSAFTKELFRNHRIELDVGQLVDRSVFHAFQNGFVLQN